MFVELFKLSGRIIFRSMMLRRRKKNIYTWFPYSCLSIESWVLNMVCLFPSLIVPPRSPEVCSGISITTGLVVWGLISVVWASFFCRTFRANSITAHWRPKQTPNKGFDVVLAQLAAAIFPSTPRVPKPPGMIRPVQKKLFKQLYRN